MKFSDLWVFWTLHLGSYSSKKQAFKNTKLELEVRRVCTIDGRPHPLLVIYTYGASVSDYNCHLNIHYLLHHGNPWCWHQLLCQQDISLSLELGTQLLGAEESTDREIKQNWTSTTTYSLLTALKYVHTSFN